MNKSQLIILGSGTPNPDPDRNGPAQAVIAGEKSYLIDCGVGVMRQVQRAFSQGVLAMDPAAQDVAFITHLHSDHTLGLADLILTPWVLERSKPLRLFGPRGLKKMVEHLLKAYEIDIQGRIRGLEQANETGIQVEVTEISEGMIYRDQFVQVEAFRVKHPPFEAYGYQFFTPDKRIVLSGDTAPCKGLIEKAKDCDILVHEVLSSEGLQFRTAIWKKYHQNVHTGSRDLAEIARLVNPRILVLTHQLFMSASHAPGVTVSEAEREAQIIQDVRCGYQGEIYSARDMDCFE